mmetsp:Transcript_46492/g.41544  ORF Transcript_46492/g.41544 Transcript_46492/m.41544 type:complete len:278 (-) Transcript_46492:120-953(-)
MDVVQEGPYLVTLRVDSLIHDQENGRYTLSLNGCRLSNNNNIDQNEENKEQEENITIEANASTVVKYEKGKFLSDPAGSKNSIEDEQKINEDFKKGMNINNDETSAIKQISSNNNNSILTKKDKWFLLFWAVYIIVAILLFMVIENDTFVDAFYFRIVTSFGVGYGDITPQTATGKMLNCLFIVIDLAKLAYIDWRLISLLFTYREQKIQFNMISVSPSISTPHPLPSNNNDNNNDVEEEEAPPAYDNDNDGENTTANPTEQEEDGANETTTKDYEE